jgi:SnoaL-like domain
VSLTVELESVHAVEQALALYDHLVDNGEWGQLGEVLEDDFVLNTPAGRFDGPDGARRYEELAGEHLPAHHVVNTLVEATPSPELFRAWSRFVLVTWEYQARAGDYLDVLRAHDGTAKLVSREIIPRGAGGAPKPEHASVQRWRAVGV